MKTTKENFETDLFKSSIETTGKFLTWNIDYGTTPSIEIFSGDKKIYDTIDSVEGITIKVSGDWELNEFHKHLSFVKDVLENHFEKAHLFALQQP